MQTHNLLDYSPKADVFYFKTKNPNARKIYGASRAASKHGGFVWYFPCAYPNGYIALKDFKNLIGGKATDAALKKINYLKEVPEHIANQTQLSSLPIDFKLAPYPHQLEVAEAMLHYSRLAVLLEQGMGKTYATHIFLEALKLQKERGIKSIILAPVIVLKNWMRETKANTSFKPLLYRGTEEERMVIREQMQDENWDILVTNYETLVPVSQDFTKTGITNWWMSMSDDRRGQLVDYWVGKGFIPKDKAGISEIEYRTVKGETQVKKKYLDTVYKTIKRVPRANLLSPELLKMQRRLSDIEFLKQLPCDALILDEGSRVKGHKSKRSYVTMELAAPIPRRYILSGTLCLGNPTDVYMPMTLLDQNIFGTNYYKFERQYAIYSQYNKHVITRWKNLDKLKMRMDPYVIERKRSDCLYLPERIMTNRYYDISKEQKELYNAIVSNDIVEVGGKQIDVSLPVVKINKINQVLNGHIILPFPRNDSKCNACEFIVTCVEDDIYPWTKNCFKYDPQNKVPKPKREYHELSSNPKTDFLVHDLELSESKVIIWAYYRYDITKIKEVLTKNKIKFISADEDDCDYKFESDDSYRVFLGQVSQGIGITLNSATTTIYYSHGLGLEPRLQSLDRNHRIGQTQKVLVKDYIGDRTIEETIVTLLQHKQDVKDFIQGKTNCSSCGDYERCRRDGVQLYSEKCILHDQKLNAEVRKIIRLKEI